MSHEIITTSPPAAAPNLSGDDYVVSNNKLLKALYENMGLFIYQVVKESGLSCLTWNEDHAGSNPAYLTKAIEL